VQDTAVSSPATGWDRRRERVSRAIERVALELFAKSSPEEVTIEQIAAAAGISNRTFFRYFASRDDILAALPTRSLEHVSARVRARPSSESVIEAFAEAGQDPDESDEDRELVLLWGLVVHRSPDAAARALGHSTIGVAEVFQVLVAERLGIDATSDRAGALGAAIAGVVGYTFHQWVIKGGRVPLGTMLAEAFDSLNDLRSTAPPALE
jgi:TetR/AcrR family transcriptional regulator, regulator of mycofactocin system